MSANTIPSLPRTNVRELPQGSSTGHCDEQSGNLPLPNRLSVVIQTSNTSLRAVQPSTCAHAGDSARNEHKTGGHPTPHFDCHHRRSLDICGGIDFFLKGCLSPLQSMVFTFGFHPDSLTRVGWKSEQVQWTDGRLYEETKRPKVR